MRPALRLISDSARWPKITAAIDAGAKQRMTPQIKLASALLLCCGGTPHSDSAMAICGTGCATPQYGQTATKSAKFPRQFVHCFKFTLRRARRERISTSRAECKANPYFRPSRNSRLEAPHAPGWVRGCEQIFSKFTPYDCQRVKGGRE